MSEHRRLDPETLLKQIQQEELDSADQSGILKIYLGYSAGVGKTYRMLQNALMLKNQGVDVVVGVVETHKRAETEALLAGLEIIPRRKIDYQGIQVDELDIDALIKRRPALALVDELAHTNIAGSRNTKRYQDIDELIKAGINVATTLNVQHLESTNDIIVKMTGIKVKEIVPDSFFNSADEIELVDIPIEELEKRLKEGKVYIPEKARLAMLEFFNKSNLMGLRELSLRYTARQVSEEILSYMRNKAIKNPIPVGSRLLVAMGPSPSNQNLIRIGSRMAEDLEADWFAVTVESMQFGNMNEGQQKQLTSNIKLAESLGAKVVNLVGDRVATEIAEYARENNITLILTGFSSRSRLNNFLRGSIVDELIRLARPIQIMLVETEDKKSIQKTSIQASKKQPWAHYSLSTLIVSAFSGLSFLLFPYIGFVNITMLLLLPLLVIGVFWGKKPALWATFLSVGYLDFFFVKPFFNLSIEDIQYLPVFIVFFAVGVTTSILSDLLKWRIDTYRKQEKFLNRIYQYSRDLLSRNNLQDVVRFIQQELSDFFQAEALVLLPNAVKELRLQPDNEITGHFSEKEISISQWVYQNNKPAGIGTDTLSSSLWYYLPLSSNRTVSGVLAIRKLSEEQTFSSDEESYLDSFSAISATAISRALSWSSTMDFIIKSL